MVTIRVIYYDEKNKQKYFCVKKEFIYALKESSSIDKTHPSLSLYKK